MLAAANQNLPSVLQDITPTVDHYGYLAVLALVFVEDFGVPVPGETVLIVGAVEAGGGRLNIALVVLFAFCAAVFGDNVGFAVGRLGGRRVVERYGRYVLVTPARLDKATGFFDRHGGKVITIARFVEGLRQTNGIIAGTTGMRWRRSSSSMRLARRSGCSFGARWATSPEATSTRSTATSRATTSTSRLRWASY